jgi:hypothetical protein
MYQLWMAATVLNNRQYQLLIADTKEDITLDGSYMDSIAATPDGISYGCQLCE